MCIQNVIGIGMFAILFIALFIVIGIKGGWKEAIILYSIWIGVSIFIIAAIHLIEYNCN